MNSKIDKIKVAGANFFRITFRCEDGDRGFLMIGEGGEEILLWLRENEIGVAIQIGDIVRLMRASGAIWEGSNSSEVN